MNWMECWPAAWLGMYVSSWLINWLIDWLINSIDSIAWLIDWLIDWLDWLIWLIDWLISWSIDWLIDWIEVFHTFQFCTFSWRSNIDLIILSEGFWTGCNDEFYRLGTGGNAGESGITTRWLVHGGPCTFCTSRLCRSESVERISFGNSRLTF